MERFFAINAQTANAELASICKIGLVGIDADGNEDFAREWLVDPEDDFDRFNSSLHGISAEAVRGAATFPTVIAEIAECVGDQVLACHTHTTKTSIRQASAQYGLPAFKFAWLDSAQVARRQWDAFVFGGAGLSEVADFLDIRLQRYDALDQVRTVAAIVASACEQSGFDPSEWRRRVQWRLGTDGQGRMRRAGSENGPLAGQVVVFTGELEFPRREMADMAAEMGAAVEDGVNKRTTMLVVGRQDLRKLNGRGQSNKQRKAEAAIAKGHSIQLLSDKDFMAICADDVGGLIS